MTKSIGWAATAAACVDVGVTASPAPMYGLMARLLSGVIAAAEKRGDARSFAHVFAIVVGVRGWISLQEFSDRIDVPTDVIASWRAPGAAPKAMMREFVLDELQAVLAADFDLTAPADAIADADLLAATKRDFEAIIKQKLLGGADLDQKARLATLAPVVAFVRPSLLKDIAYDLGCADTDAERWAAGVGLPRGDRAQKLMDELARAFDVDASCGRAFA